MDSPSSKRDSIANELRDHVGRLEYHRRVAIDVEVNLKIPSLTIRSVGKPDQKIDNGAVRFSKRIAVDSVPKPRDWLSLSTQFGDPFECTVTRSDWNEEKNLFIVSSAYGATVHYVRGVRR